MSTANDVIKMIQDREVKWADLRFTDTRGKEQHVTIPAKTVGSGRCSPPSWQTGLRVMPPKPSGNNCNRH